ncbi:MAG TPA: hypothetical protein PKC83_11015 [Gemmatimonadaceae bacterium]|nr:hypothetical protein [Gemmatimonadaceae bacterium]
MSATAQTIIGRAFRLLGLYEAAETAPAGDLAVGLAALNGLCDEWNAEPHGPQQSYSALSSTLSLPDGMEQALVYNLAVAMAPEFGATPTPEVARRAERTLAVIKRTLREEDPVRTCDPGVGGFVTTRFNLYTGS